MPDRLITLDADLTAANAAALQEKLCAVDGASVTIDGSKAERISASCLQLLIAAGQKNKRFRLVNPSPALMRGARLAGAVSLLPIEGSAKIQDSTKEGK